MYRKKWRVTKLPLGILLVFRLAAFRHFAISTNSIIISYNKRMQLYDLPDESLLQISRNLSNDSLLSISQSSKRFRNISNDATKSIIEQTIGEPIDCYRSGYNNQNCRWILSIDPTIDNLEKLVKVNKQATAYVYLSNLDEFNSSNELTTIIIKTDNINAFTTMASRLPTIYYSVTLAVSMRSTSDKIVKLIYKEYIDKSDKYDVLSIAGEAIEYGYDYIVKYIIESRPLSRSDLIMISDHAAENGDVITFDYLYKISHHIPGHAIMLTSINNNNYGVVKYVLDNDFYNDDIINRLFFHSLRQGDEKMIRIFLDHGANIYAYDTEILGIMISNEKVRDLILLYGYNTNLITDEVIVQYISMPGMFIDTIINLIDMSKSELDFRHIFTMLVYNDDFTINDIDNFISHYPQVLELGIDEPYELIDNNMEKRLEFLLERGINIPYEDKVTILYNAFVNMKQDLIYHIIDKYDVDVNDLDSTVISDMIETYFNNHHDNDDYDIPARQEYITSNLHKLLMDKELTRDEFIEIYTNDYDDGDGDVTDIMDMLRKYGISKGYIDE